MQNVQVQRLSPELTALKGPLAFSEPTGVLLHGVNNPLAAHSLHVSIVSPWISSRDSRATNALHPGLAGGRN